jgi:nitrite reductase/ring-hydroxylating ferredoxin subunit
MTSKEKDPEKRSDFGLQFVIAADELQEGDRVITEIQGKEIAVFNVGGEYRALANYCTHQGGPVCEGPVNGTIGVDEEWNMIFEQEDELIICPWHGWSFEMETGRHIAKSNYTLPTYEVVEKEGDIYISL